MAPRKQPIRLEESALKVVAKYCADTVMNYSEDCNAAVLVSYIMVQNNKVFLDVPRVFFNDFVVMFLQRITEVHGDRVQDWVNRFGTVVIDVILDDRLTKLGRYPRVADHLMHVLYCKMDRLQNLRHLHLGTGRAESLSNLKNCNLKYLTRFGCHYTCTDEVLRLIAECCPNLTTLDIQWSGGITSVGLDVLKKCSKLSMVNSKHCCIQANDLITHLLGHDTIKNIAHSIDNPDDLMSFSTGVYPTLKSLRMQNKEITTAALDVIVKSFPNLDTLFFYRLQITGDLRLLRFLPRLTSLGIRCYPGYKMEQVESLLTEVGNNYSTLSIIVNASQLQHVVNVVYKTCKNMKNLSVAFLNRHGLYTVTIPPFENLESLSVEPLGPEVLAVYLIFTRLLALKKLCLVGCRADFESILLDHDNFPCITKVRHGFFDSEKLEIVRKIIKENNLDVHYRRHHRREDPDWN